METYIIRVNGTVYEVEVEKKGEQPASSVTQKPQEPRAQQATQPAMVSEETGEPITVGTAGKVWKTVLQEGAEVKKGDTVMILEAMKMEIPVVAPKDGKITKIALSEGDSVEAGQTAAWIA